MKEIIEQAYDEVMPLLEGYSNWGLTPVAQQEIIIKNEIYKSIGNIKRNNSPAAVSKKEEINSVESLNRYKNFIEQSISALTNALFLETFIQAREDVGIEKINASLHSKLFNELSNQERIDFKENLNAISSFIESKDSEKIYDFISKSTDLQKKFITKLAISINKLIPAKKFEFGERIKKSLAILNKAKEELEMGAAEKKSSKEENEISVILKSFLKEANSIIYNVEQSAADSHRDAVYFYRYRDLLKTIIKCFCEAIKDLENEKKLNPELLVNVISQTRYYNSQINTMAKIKKNYAEFAISKESLLRSFANQRDTSQKSDCALEKLLVKTQNELLKIKQNSNELANTGNQSFKNKIEKQKIILKCLMKTLKDLDQKEGFFNLSGNENNHLSNSAKEKLAFENYKRIIDNTRLCLDKISRNANSEKEKQEKAELYQKISEETLNNGELKKLLLIDTDKNLQDRTQLKVMGNDSDIEITLLRIRNQEPALFNIDRIIAKIETAMPEFKVNFNPAAFFENKKALEDISASKSEDSAQVIGSTATV